MVRPEGGQVSWNRGMDPDRLVCGSKLSISVKARAVVRPTVAVVAILATSSILDGSSTGFSSQALTDSWCGYFQLYPAPSTKAAIVAMLSPTTDTIQRLYYL